MDRNKEKELRDVLIKHLRNAGIHVVTDQKEGQSVLNDAGFTTKMQSRLGQLKDAVDFIRKKLKLASSGQTPIQVTEWVHKKTENILGHRIMEHLIDVSGLNHAYNNHGVGGKKLTPNDIPLTKQDIELAPYILMNPDKIERGTPNSGRESIIYEKTLSNGRIIYIEAEEGLDGQSLVSKNMWANIDPRKLSPFKVADARSEERPHVSTSDNVILDDDRAKIIKDAETAIKNEEILARADKLFVFSDKTIYGFVKNDTIYIDTNELNIETPIHEYAHLWAEALRQQNTYEWKNVVSIMKSRTELWNKVKEDYPHLETDDEIADEVLATYSGQHGMQRLREECRNYKDGDTVLNRISAALDHFWENMSHFFGIQYKSAEEVADRVFYDLMNEVNPLVYTKKGVQKFSDRMILGHKNTEQTEHNKTEGETYLLGFNRGFSYVANDEARHYRQYMENPFSEQIGLGEATPDYDSADAAGLGVQFPILLKGTIIGWLPVDAIYDKDKPNHLISDDSHYLRMSSVGDSAEIKKEYRGQGYGKAAYYELAVNRQCRHCRHYGSRRHRRCRLVVAYLGYH